MIVTCCYIRYREMQLDHHLERLADNAPDPELDAPGDDPEVRLFCVPPSSPRTGGSPRSKDAHAHTPPATGHRRPLVSSPHTRTPLGYEDTRTREDRRAPRGLSRYS